MKITTVGIDLAKNLFQVHAVDERGKAVLRKQLRRKQVAVFFGNLPPCVIGMEACASAHHWARTLQRFGHIVRLMAPQFVKPYVKTNKNDVADAEAICEAVGRANMRFVPIKSIEQQAILSVHRVRQGFVKARTAQANQIRGLLGEFGLIIPQGIINVAKRVPEILEDASNELPVPFRHLIDRLTEHLKELDRQVKEFEKEITAWHRSSELEPQAREDPGHRSVGRQRTGRFHRRCQELRKRPAGGGLAGACATAILQRRQIHAAGHEQARRRLLANAAHTRRAFCRSWRQRTRSTIRMAGWPIC